MKKNNYIALILIICLAFCFALAGCGKKPSGSDSNAPAADTKTLESVATKDSKIQEELKKNMDANEGLVIEIKGNDLIYTYDMTVLSSDPETLKSDAVKNALADAIEEQKSVFGDICKTLEDETGIQGIQTVVNYTAGEEVLLSRIFTSADAE